MSDSPGWMGLAPLLGFLLDALLGGLRGHRVIRRAVARVAARARFVLKIGLPGSERLAGWTWLIWVVGLGFLAGRAIEGLSWVMFEEAGRFAARAGLVFFALATRRVATVGMQVTEDLEHGAEAAARNRLATLDATAEPRPPANLATWGVRSMAAGLLERSLLPLLGGILLGGGGALAGAAARELAALAERDTEASEEFLQPVRSVYAALLALPAWTSALLLPPLMMVVGGRRDAAFAAWLREPQLPPSRRLQSMVERGLHIELRSTEVGAPPSEDTARSADVQRSVILVWLTSFTLALAGALVGTLVYSAL